MIKADKIFLNGKILTMEPEEKPGSFFVALKGDRILGVGEKGGEKEFLSLRTEVIDAKGGTILPGFIDAHLHLSIMAEMVMQLDVSPEAVSTFDQIRTMIKTEAQKLPEGTWIRGAGYDDTKLKGNALTRWNLDEVAPKHPVFITHVSAHWGVTNSKGLSLGGLHDESKDPPGGSLGRNPETRRLNGLLYEDAAFPYYLEALSPTDELVIPPFSQEELRSGVLRVGEKYLKAGITGVHDAMATPRFLKIYQDLRDAHQLPLRIYSFVPYKYFGLFRDSGIRSRFGDEWLSIGAVKMIVDGAIAGRTAYLKEPYSREDLGSGILLLKEDQIRAMIFEYHQAGFQVAVHANGDRAIEMTLDGFEEALQRVPRENHRHRIEHCSLVTDEILGRMNRLGLMAIPFGSYVWHHGEKILPFYGEERARRLFPHKSFLDHGIKFAGSTDNPCGPYEPLLAIQSCVTRRSADGVPLGENQRIPLAEALKMYTMGSAYASFEEDRKGSFRSGKLADVVVLGEDITKVHQEEIKDIPVRLTMVGGDIKFCS